jgi:hypothetical protein
VISGSYFVSIPTPSVGTRFHAFNVKSVNGMSVRFITDARRKVNEMALSTPDGVFSARYKP